MPKNKKKDIVHPYIPIDFDLTVDHGLDIISFNEPPLQNQEIEEIVTREDYQKMIRVASQRRFRDDVNVVLVQESGRYYLKDDRTAHKEGIPLPANSVRICTYTSDRKILSDFRDAVDARAKPKKKR